MTIAFMEDDEMLSNLLNLNPHDLKSIETWALSNSEDHEEIRQAIQTQKSVNLNDWIIYPLTLKDWDAYAIRHQSAHNDMNAQVGLSGVDLTEINFKDPKSIAYWNWSHWREHLAARAALKI